MNRESMHQRAEVGDTLEYRQQESDFDTLCAIEQDEIVNNPENIGYNITDAFLIRPTRMQQLAEIQALIDKVGEDAAFEQIAPKLGLQPDEMPAAFEGAYQEEIQKIEQLKTFVEAIPDGASIRVHPYAPTSPFSIENSRRMDDDGEFFAFDPLAMEQMRDLYDKCNSGEQPGEFSVVMSPYTSERGGDIPRTDAEIDEYAQMCISFLEQMGLRENGGAGICLELGNETNVGLDTKNPDGSPMFEGMLGFARSVDVDAYARMYARVAQKIKAEFPNAEIAIAGTAMFDDIYLEEVITKVTAENDGQTGLIDKISFHPYRSTVGEATTTFVDGPDGKVRTESSLSYDKQCERMEELVQLAGAKRYDVGEVAFVNWESPEKRSINTEEMHKNSSDARARGLKSYIWPSDMIIQYG